ncbi:MAG: hypothetical protein ACOC4J_04870, partial [Bacteroidota bacterium]
YIPLEHNLAWQYEHEILKSEKSVVTSFKPFYITGYHPDSLVSDSLLMHSPKGMKTWFQRKLFSEHFFRVKEGSLAFVMDPLAILSLGHDDQQTEPLYRNTRGIRLEGMLGPNLSFTSSFYENQARFPLYLTQWAGEKLVIPGQGTIREFGVGGYDFNWADGRITFNPGEKWLFEMGHGKKYIGNGYRSLILSDNAFNYPYLLVGFKNKWFHFYKMHASLMHDIFFINRSNVMYNRKTASMHYFGFQPIKNLEISFFDGFIWSTPDSTGQFNFEAEMLSPVPFKLNDPKKNIITGININYTLNKSYQMYGQWMFDDFKFTGSQNFLKQGFQAGLKAFSPFSLSGLFLLAEVNQVWPYTYSQASPEFSYTHYNQALAHPLGANFREWVVIATYEWKRLRLYAKMNLARYGTDNENEHWGKDIFKSTDDASLSLENSLTQLFQGNQTSSTIMHSRLSVIVNPNTNLLLSLGFQKRVLSGIPEINSNSGYFYVSLHSNLNNFYYDF